MSLLFIFVLAVFVFSLVSRPVDRTNFTPPIVFTAVGLAATIGLTEATGEGIDADAFLTVAELGLVLLLFVDACHIDLKALSSFRAMPARLLSIGLVLTIALGLLAARLLFGSLSWWEAGILAAVLAPTDAGLGKAIVADERVPLPIRQSLNVEAGLNDGLVVPFLLFFIALAGPVTGHDVQFVGIVAEQLGVGAAIGVGVGLGGGWLVWRAHQREWIGAEFAALVFLSLPALCLLFTHHWGGSAFIAAFVAGLAVPRKGMHASSFGVTFVHDWGQIINLAVFFLFGVLTALNWRDITAVHVLYGLLSLTVIRMVPVAIAMIGSGLSLATVGFAGWFGPRGLASIVLGLVYYEHVSGAHVRDLTLAVTATVFMSILAHGFTARPGAKWYARTIASLPESAPERTI